MNGVHGAARSTPAWGAKEACCADLQHCSITHVQAGGPVPANPFAMTRSAAFLGKCWWGDKDWRCFLMLASEMLPRALPHRLSVPEMQAS